MAQKSGKLKQLSGTDIVNFSAKDIQFILDELSDLISNDFTDGAGKYSEWEQDFVSSVKEQFEYRGELSAKQRAKLKQIWEK